MSCYNTFFFVHTVLFVLHIMCSHSWKYSPLVRAPLNAKAPRHFGLFSSLESELESVSIHSMAKTEKKSPHSKGIPFKNETSHVNSNETKSDYSSNDLFGANTSNFTSSINQELPKFRKIQPEAAKSEGKAWFPVTLLDTIDDKYPKQVQLLGNKYVVWRNQNAKYDPKVAYGWNVMLDQCSHRLAPLSEGRVDPRTNCLECPYHGWQFQSRTGECQFIPQSSRSALDNKLNLIPPSINSRSKIPSYPVHVTPNILWAYLPMPHSNFSMPIHQLPESILPSLSNAKSFFSREVPYSFDVALENFMDPAHVPFAHHKLSNDRKQGTPLSIKIATDIRNDSKELTFEYERKINPKLTLKALYSFYSPCYYQIRIFPFRPESNQKAKSENKLQDEGISSKTNYQNVLSLLVAPISPGRSRVFVALPRAVGIASRFLPKWVQHRFWMKFFDSDIWLYDQEKSIRSPSNAFEQPDYKLDAEIKSNATTENILEKFTLMTSSDRGVIAWRQWWSQHMSFSPIFGVYPRLKQLPTLSPAELRNRYSSHTKDCISCQNTLKFAKAIRNYLAPLISVMMFALFVHLPNRTIPQLILPTTVPSKLRNYLPMANKIIDLMNANLRGVKMLLGSFAGALTFIKSSQLADEMIRATEGPEKYEKLSAAQMFPK